MKPSLKIVVATVVMLFTSIAYSNGQVPQDVISAFTSSYPNSTSVNWSKENAHEYEVTFRFQDNNCTANYTDQAQWIGTKTTLDYSELSSVVKNAFKNVYGDAKIKDIIRIEVANNPTKFEIYYKVGFKNKVSYFDERGSEVR
jgi:hypothetical protein